MNDFALSIDIEIVMELLDITAKDLAEVYWYYADNNFPVEKK